MNPMWKLETMVGLLLLQHIPAFAETLQGSEMITLLATLGLMGHTGLQVARRNGRGNGAAAPNGGGDP